MKTIGKHTADLDHRLHLLNGIASDIATSKKLRVESLKMLPNKPQTENVTSGFKSTFNLTATETLADRRSIGDSLDGGSNLEAGFKRKAVRDEN